MKKIALALLVSLLITGCSIDAAPEKSEGVKNEEVKVEETEVKDEELEEPVVETPTPEELAEAERLKKEKDEELRLKVEKANEERLVRMTIDQYGMYNLHGQGLTLDEVLLQVPSSEKLDKSQLEYKEKQALVRKQIEDIQKAKETNKPHVLKPDIEREILDVTNRYRAEVGAPKLRWSDEMHQYSRSYNLYMFTYSIWEHNIVYPSAENLWMSGTRDPETCDAEYIVADWMDSPGHKKNLLNPDHRVMGAAVLIGVTKHPVTGETKPVLFATQQFYDN